MNSDVEKMLELLSRIEYYKTAIWYSMEHNNDTRYDEMVERVELAKQEFENALISLIDERINIMVGER
jgi:hypothetical protein